MRPRSFRAVYEFGMVFSNNGHDGLTMLNNNQNFTDDLNNVWYTSARQHPALGSFSPCIIRLGCLSKVS